MTFSFVLSYHQIGKLVGGQEQGISVLPLFMFPWFLLNNRALRSRAVSGWGYLQGVKWGESQQLIQRHRVRLNTRSITYAKAPPQYRWMVAIHWTLSEPTSMKLFLNYQMQFWSLKIPTHTCDDAESNAPCSQPQLLTCLRLSCELLASFTH